VAARRIVLPETLTAASLASLAASLDEAAEDEQAGVWVLACAPGTFCRGMDLGSMATQPAGDGLRAFAAVLAALRNAPRPTVALVDGEAMGGGVGLAAACDLVLATERASFALPEALFGLVPAIIMPVLLERMKAQKARLFALLGQGRAASWAKEQGLVDEIVSSEDAERALARAMRDLGRAAPSAIRRVRSCVADASRLPSDVAAERAIALMTELTADEGIRNSVREFVEGGVPPWIGRGGR